MHANKFVVVFLVALWTTAFAKLEKGPDFCRYRDSYGREYDLTALANPSSGGYTFVAGIDTVYFNVCGDLSKLVNSPGCSEDSAVCLVENGVPESLGAASTAEFTDLEENLGVTLTYSGGDRCDASDGSSSNFKTIMNFVCSPAPSNVGLGVLSAENLDDCTMMINFTSTYACPVDSSVMTASMWWVQFLSWFASFVALISCCMCCIICVRHYRERKLARANIERVFTPYTPLSTAESMDTTVINMEPAPAYSSIALTSDYYVQPQFVPVYPGLYPSFPSAPEFQTVTPSAPALNNSAVSPNTNNDEQLARALQEQYNRGL